MARAARVAAPAAQQVARASPARAATARASSHVAQDTLRRVLGSPGAEPLRLGEPGDACEREAERVAERLALAPRPLQGPASPGAAGRTARDLTGRALPADARLRLEQQLGADLGGVRLHVDGGAAQAARALGARAFTVGEHIVFGAGEFQPDSREGRRLLVHELSHVLQQRGAPGSGQQIHERAPFAALQRCPELSLFRASHPDLTELSDEEKRALRRLIRGCAEMHVGEFAETVPDLPALSALRGEQRQSHRNAVAIADRGIAALSRTPGASQRDVRLAFLRALRFLLDEPLFAHYHLRYPATVNEHVLEQVGSPALELVESDVAWLRAMTGVINRDRGHGLLVILNERGVYRALGITPEDLRTADDVAPEEAREGGEPGTPPPGELGAERSAEEYALLERVAEVAREADVPTDPAEIDAALARLRRLSEEELREFLDFYRDMQTEEEDAEEPTGMETALERFQSLSDVEREILRTNRELARGDEAATDAGELRLSLRQDAEEHAARAREANRVNDIVGQINGVLGETEGGPMPALPGGFNLLLAELTMFRGLLAGASQRSPEIRAVSVDLLAEIDALMQRILDELAWALGVQGLLLLLSAISAGTATPFAIGAAVNRMRRLVALIEAAQRAYAIYERIRGVVEIVSNAGETYRSFRASVDDKLERLARLEQQLAELDAPEDVDAEIERLRNEVMDAFQAQLGPDGQLGEVLQLFYIPEDASDEELTEILLDMPRGIDDLQQLVAYYREHGESEDSERAAVLGAIAVRAGARLYPLVGFLAATVAGELPNVLPERSVSERLQQFGERVLRGGSGRARGDRNRGLFARLRRDHYDYDATELAGHLRWGVQRLGELLSAQEPGEASAGGAFTPGRGFVMNGRHFTRAWFRFSARQQLRVLQREAVARRVHGRTRRRGRTPAGPRESLPLPRFRLDFPLFSLSSRRHQVSLELNPSQTLSVDALSHDDFAGAGVRFLGTDARRQRALTDWLDESGYEFTSDRHGNRHLRREGGAHRRYLQLDGDSIKQDDDLDISERLLGGASASNFAGKHVESSSDLPEGYHLTASSGPDGALSRKSGTRARGMPRLGLDDEGNLVVGEGSRAPRPIEPFELRTAEQESYDWRAAPDEMFDADGTARAGVDAQDQDRAAWQRRLARTADLQQRPRRIRAKLGYVYNARLAGDLLGSRHLPSKRTSDDKGHVIARRFGSPVDDPLWNLIPMRRSLNRAPGAWYSMESDLAAFYTERAPGSQATLDFEVQLEYPDLDTRRPSRLRAIWQSAGTGARALRGSRNFRN